MDSYERLKKFIEDNVLEYRYGYFDGVVDDLTLDELLQLKDLVKTVISNKMFKMGN